MTDDIVGQLVAKAKTWRGMTKLVVLELNSEGTTSERAVKLGETRRRWKRIAEALAPMMAGSIVGARGFDAKGELVGAWDVPDDEQDEDEQAVAGEPDHLAQHRLHTQWCLREAAKMHEVNTRLTIELVGAVIEVVRAIRSTVATPSGQSQDDETTKTLGLILQAVVGGNPGRSADENEREARIPDGDAGRPGQPKEPAAAGP